MWQKRTHSGISKKVVLKRRSPRLMASYSVPHIMPAPHRTMMKAMTEAYGIRPRQSTEPVERGRGRDEGRKHAMARLIER